MIEFKIAYMTKTNSDDVWYASMEDGFCTFGYEKEDAGLFYAEDILGIEIMVADIKQTLIDEMGSNNVEWMVATEVKKNNQEPEDYETRKKLEEEWNEA